MNFKGNFGELTLIINGTEATGTYQEKGVLKGEFINNTFKGQWENKGMEGLVEFTITNGKLEGNWKKGLELGPMKGKWEGALIDLQQETNELQKKELSTDEWNIIHDILCFYTFFANLANDGSQELENNFVQTEIKKWKFEINGVKYGLDYGNPQNFISLADSVFDALYIAGDSPHKDPFIQLNESHSNLAGYFNQRVLNCNIICNLWSSMIKLCQLRGITEWQDQQLRWYIEQWSSVCSDLSKHIAILNIGEVKKDMAEAVGLEFDEKYHEAKEIILGEGAALPEILCDVLLIGKNRAERIFDQFERDGIVSPKDENGKRKIIKQGANEESSDVLQIEGSTNKEEASTEQKIHRKNYPLFPVNWGVENVIVIPIRHCMIADGVVNQMEKNAMAHFFEKFGEIGKMAELEWDITDDQIMQIHSEGKYMELLADSANYLKENLDEEQLSKLIWYMATIVSEDDVIQYSEFITIKFYFDKWFPNALDTYIEKFKNAGMTIITEP